MDRSFSRMSQAHLWAGITEKAQNEFDHYFDQSAAFLFDETGREKSSSEIELSRFSRDLEKDYPYEDDFLVTYYEGGKPVEIAALLKKMEDISSPEMVRLACINRGITKANAFFLYTDARLQIKDTDKRYNDLVYIGLFGTAY